MTNKITTEKVESLSELENKIKNLKENEENKNVYKILFRGHQNADWNLETTLERDSESGKELTIEGYNEFLFCSYSQIATFTGKTWEVSPYTDKEYTSRFFDYGSEEHAEKFYKPYNENPHVLFVPPNIKFMLYARHHGLPTPLLDWTTSLYIALFFSFRNKIECKSAAIFALFYRAVGTTNGEPVLNIIGSNIVTHKRHLLQQAEYTCTVAKNENNEAYYCPHLSAIDKENRADKNGYKIIQFILPATQRKEILKQLYDYNINAYSLFQTEDALCEYIATQRDLQKYFKVFKTLILSTLNSK